MRGLARYPLSFALCCAAALAQEGAVGGPSLGLLYDPAARTLHSVNGVAAAALLSERARSLQIPEGTRAATGEGAESFGAKS